MIHSLLSTIGDFAVINFRDATAESDLINKTVIFEFDLLISLNTSISYNLHLTWSQVSGPSSGVIEAANCKYNNQSNAQMERINDTGTYRLYVPLHLLGDGRLQVKLTINISCNRYLYNDVQHQHWYPQYSCGCDDWQFRGISDILWISQKQGK